MVVAVLVQCDSDISGTSLMVFRQRFSVGGTGRATRVAGDVTVYSAATLFPDAQCALFWVLSKSYLCCGAGYI